MGGVMEFLTNHMDLIEAIILGGAVIISGVSTIAAATKTKKDDKVVGIMAKVADFLKRLASLK